MSDDEYDQAAKEISYLQGQLWVMAAVAFAVVAAVGSGDPATVVAAATLATGLSMVMAGGLLAIHVGMYTDIYENAADGALFLGLLIGLVAGILWEAFRR